MTACWCGASELQHGEHGAQGMQVTPAVKNEAGVRLPPSRGWSMSHPPLSSPCVGKRSPGKSCDTWYNASLEHWIVLAGISAAAHWECLCSSGFGARAKPAAPLEQTTKVASLPWLRPGWITATCCKQVGLPLNWKLQLALGQLAGTAGKGGGHMTPSPLPPACLVPGSSSQFRVLVLILGA